MADVPASSQLARLRARAAQARQSQWVDCELEPLGIVVRYGPLSDDQTDRINRQHSGPALNVAVLVEACLAILVVDDDGQLTSLDPDGKVTVDDGRLSGDLLTFTSSRTAELLDVGSASEAVRLVYGEAGRTLQLARDADDVVFLSRGETKRMSRPPGAGRRS